MDCCREAEGLHQSVGNRAWANVNLGAIGRIHWKRGEAALAVECLRESEQDAHDRGWVLDEAFHANYRGRALIDLRRFDEAEQALRRAKELQEQGQENRSYRYFGALVNLAWAVSQQGNEDSEDVKNCITLAGQLKKDLRSEEQVESLEIQEDLAKFAKLATMCQESQ